MLTALKQGEKMDDGAKRAFEHLEARIGRGQSTERGRVKRVYMQGDAPARMRPDDLGRWFVRNGAGQIDKNA